MTFAAAPARLSTSSATFEQDFAQRLHWSADTDAAIEQRVAAILADVRQRGDAAVLDYTARFDGLQAGTMAALELTQAELKVAYDSLPAVQRNALAAAQSHLRPWLEQTCAWLGCTIGPDQSIAAVAIDSSGFVKAGRGDSYQLTLALKNLSGAAVAMPAVELTLTDAQDQPVLRRVLFPAELGAPVELAAHGEWSGQTMVVLAGPALRLSGYRVLAFYP